MSRKTKIINMSLPEDLYSDLGKIADMRQVSRSRILKEALDKYVDEERRWQQIRKWGDETAELFNIKNENDVEKIIDEYRKEKR